MKTVTEELVDLVNSEIESDNSYENSYEYHNPYRVNDIPGRNDKCPCGSGKKFKKCCINRIKKEYTES